jgi:translation initiation factor 1
MEKKPRIAFGAPQAALQSPFSALSISGLPKGPADPEVPEAKPGTGRLVFRKEKARRGGKSVVVVSGFDPAFPQESIEELAREVRRQCGCGGTVRDREIEFQGDDPERFRTIFRESGFLR